MAAFDYDCPTVANGFIANINQYANEIASRSIPYIPWLANTPRGNWDRSRGKIQTSIVFGRTVPTDTGEEWADTVSSDDQGATTNACDLGTPEIVRFGQSTRSMRRQRRYIQTDDFCLEELLDDYKIEQFLRGVGRSLAGVSQYVWATRRRREYARLAEHKITEDGSGVVDFSQTEYDPANPPTSRLLNGTLEQISDYLDLDGRGASVAIGKTATGQGVATLMTDSNTSRDLIRQDPELRQDFRFAFEGMGEKSPLLTAYGLGRDGSGIAYNGYKHVRDFPRRFNIVGGAYVEVHPYGSPQAVVKGYDQPVSMAYLYATYQESVIHFPSVVREMVQTPVSNPGGAFQFGPQNYMGDFMFQVIKDRKCNPREKYGYFDAEFVSASEPGDTWFGFTILHLNCLPRRERKPCDQYETYA